MSEWNKFNSSECPCPPMPPIKFQLDLMSFGSRCRFKILKLATLAILDIGTERLSNSQSSCHPNASHQVWPEYDLQFGSRRSLKIFKMATVAAILDIGTGDFSNSESLCCLDTFHQISAQSDLLFARRCHLKTFKMADMVVILDIGKKLF